MEQYQGSDSISTSVGSRLVVGLRRSPVRCLSPASLFGSTIDMNDILTRDCPDMHLFAERTLAPAIWEFGGLLSSPHQSRHACVGPWLWGPPWGSRYRLLAHPKCQPSSDKHHRKLVRDEITISPAWTFHSNRNVLIAALAAWRYLCIRA